MTTLKDLLNDFQQETIELTASVLTQEEDYEILLDELIEDIKKRLIG